MKPQPFCCDIMSGTKEEQNEFKKLFEEAIYNYEKVMLQATPPQQNRN